ncbi:TlpA family protein disulfide reductase [Candidatus Poriferisocius sp.]|uniref:TlpA family protein disulfide reductase n=1 Tax=Candidatus Poriferisocius sp. TaxID=3101276 RepID=UPI003B027351
MGTQDSLGQAEDFVSRHGTTFTMLWDRTFQSWNQLGITGQPAGMLMNRYGQIIDQWRGDIPRGQVLDAVAELSST